MECIFCKIVKGEIPIFKVFEDEEFVAFLDAFPIVKGQVLVIPKKHLGNYLFDLDDGSYNRLMVFVKKISKGIDKALNPIKTGMIVEGLEVDHVHVKLYPLREGFSNMRVLDPRPSEEEMKEIADKIRTVLESN